MSQVNRRRFLVLAGALACTRFARAQTPAQARIGWLQANPRATAQFPDLFVSAMSKLGRVEGKNLIIDWRFADGKVDQLTKLAGELVRLGNQVIVTPLNIETAAAREATHSTPIVVMGSLEPVKVGFAQSLARPGGNITGVIYGDPELAGKTTEIWTQILPGIRRVAYLYPVTLGIEPFVDAIEQTGNAVGIKTFRFAITSLNEVDRALDSIKSLRVDALRVGLGGYVGTRLDDILAFAAEHRIPTSFSNTHAVERGALLAYVPRYDELAARTASIVDRILKGAKPADTPFEYSTRYELVINLKTAKRLGITVPQSILLRADRLVE